MLSKEDYRDYLNQVEQIEIDMRDVYKKCADEVEDEVFRKDFKPPSLLDVLELF